MRAILLPLALAASGGSFLAYAEGPSAPSGSTQAQDLAEKVAAYAALSGGLLEASRRMSHGARSEARAADQRATAIGRKHDELQRDFHSEMLRRSGWEGEQRGSLEALKERLKTVAQGVHDSRTELGSRIIRLEDRFEASQDE